MKRFWFSTAVLAALLALSAPAAQAKLAGNGPALDGRLVQAPDGLSAQGASGAQLHRGPCPRWTCGGKPHADRRVATPDHVGSAQP